MAILFKYNFYAVESISGDIIQGYVYDNAGTYFDGYSHTFGTDEIGGNWTYHVTDHLIALGGALAGQVFDTTYYDGETKTWGDGYHELTPGLYSGVSGLGSESDAVQFYNGNVAIPLTGAQIFGTFGLSNGTGAYYEADKSGNQMYKYDFYATESVSGDVIQGYVYDSAGNYSVGWQHTFATDSLGGNWTYHVTDQVAVNVPIDHDQYVYDTSYYDAETKSWADGFSPLGGLASGHHGIGSDYDTAIFYDKNGATIPIASANRFGNLGQYVADQGGLQKFNFYATESASGDVIQGYTYAKPGTYFDGFTKTFVNDEINGSWTYTITDHSNTGVDPSRAGEIYDTTYYDAQTSKWADTVNGTNGVASGTAGIGSDSDVAQFYSGKNKLPIDQVHGLFGGDGYYVADKLPAITAIFKYDFYAVESVSGDIIQGYVYDNAGTYSDGYSHSFGTDEIGGSWTYHVTDHLIAPGGAVAGQVFDTTYYDGETKTWGDGYHELTPGLYSGVSGLGSESDAVQFYNGNVAIPLTGAQIFGTFGISNGTAAYYEADKSGNQMYKYDFYATESVSGDVIQGYVYDSAGNYSVGWQHTFATDSLGGNWTYHVTDQVAVNVPIDHDQYVYDTSYYDAETKSWADGFSPLGGLASGHHGIGSDYDTAIFYDKNGATIPIASANRFGNLGQYVADQGGLQKFNFYATESASGDVIQGYTYAKPGTYFDGLTKTFANDEINGSWTYTITDHSNTGVDPSRAGEIYDTTYYDAQTSKWADTVNGTNGVASGTAGIGSDSDLAQFFLGNNKLPIQSYHGLFGGDGYYVADLII